MNLLRGDFFGASKINDLDGVVPIEENVLGLDVPVDDTMGIHLEVGFHHLMEDWQFFLGL